MGMKKAYQNGFMMLVVMLGLLVSGCSTFRGNGEPDRSLFTLSRAEDRIKVEGDMTGDVPALGDRIFVQDVMCRESHGPYETMVIYIGTNDSFQTYTTWGFRTRGLVTSIEGVRQEYIVGKAAAQEESGEKSPKELIEIELYPIKPTNK
jgi:predicted small secreted protein